jgi:nucleotide-binding universal stress UspA family protein
VRTVEAGKRIELNNILFATDFSPLSNAALPYAVSIARRYGAMVHVAHVMPTEAELLLVSPENSQAVEEEDKRVEEHMRPLRNRLQELSHKVLTPRGKVSDVLAQLIGEHEIDMLVLGTHGRTGVRKFLLGSVAEETFRRANCAVLSVGPKVSGYGETESRRSVCSEESLAALPYAISLAEEDQAQLILLHVIEEPASLIVDAEAVTAYLLRYLKELVPAEAEPWCRAECLVELGRPFGPPAKRILEIARDHAADLIVLGVRSVHGKLGLMTH